MSGRQSIGQISSEQLALARGEHYNDDDDLGGDTDLFRMDSGEEDETTGSRTVQRRPGCGCSGRKSIPAPTRNYGTFNTSMKVGQTVTLGDEDMEQDIPNRDQVGVSIAEAARMGDSLSLGRLFSADMVFKRLAEMTTRPDIRFVISVSGHTRRPLNTLMEFAENFSAKALRFVAIVRNLLEDYTNTGAAKHVRGFGGHEEDYENTKELVAFLNGVTAVLKTYREERRASGGNSEDIESSTGRAIAGVVDLNRYNVGTLLRTMTRRVPINLPLLTSLVTHSNERTKLGLGELEALIFGGDVTERTTLETTPVDVVARDKVVCDVYGEGVSKALINEIVILANAVSGRNGAGNFHKVMVVDVLPYEKCIVKCDEIAGKLRHKTLTLTGIETEVVSQLSRYVSEIPGVDTSEYIADINKAATDLMRDVLNSPLIMHQDVVAASDTGYTRIRLSCQSLSKVLTKKGLMNDEDVWPLFAELTSLIMKQDAATTQYTQTRTSDMITNRIKEILTTFSIRLAYNSSTGKLYV